MGSITVLEQGVGKAGRHDLSQKYCIKHKKHYLISMINMCIFPICLTESENMDSKSLQNQQCCAFATKWSQFSTLGVRGLSSRLVWSMALRLHRIFIQKHAPITLDERQHHQRLTFKKFWSHCLNSLGHGILVSNQTKNDTLCLEAPDIAIFEWSTIILLPR